MFKRVHAEPDGNVTFEYAAFKITIDREGNTQTTSTLNSKGKHGTLDSLRNSGAKYSANKLLERI